MAKPCYICGKPIPDNVKGSFCSRACYDNYLARKAKAEAQKAGAKPQAAPGEAKPGESAGTSASYRPPTRPGTAEKAGTAAPVKAAPKAPPAASATTTMPAPPSKTPPQPAGKAAAPAAPPLKAPPAKKQPPPQPAPPPGPTAKPQAPAAPLAPPPIVDLDELLGLGAGPAKPEQKPEPVAPASAPPEISMAPGRELELDDDNQSSGLEIDEAKAPARSPAPDPTGVPPLDDFLPGAGTMAPPIPPPPIPAAAPPRPSPGAWPRTAAASMAAPVMAVEGESALGLHLIGAFWIFLSVISIWQGLNWLLVVRTVESAFEKAQNLPNIMGPAMPSPDFNFQPDFQYSPDGSDEYYPEDYESPPSFEYNENDNYYETPEDYMDNSFNPIKGQLGGPLSISPPSASPSTGLKRVKSSIYLFLVFQAATIVFAIFFLMQKSFARVALIVVSGIWIIGGCYGVYKFLSGWSEALSDNMVSMLLVGMVDRLRLLGFSQSALMLVMLLTPFVVMLYLLNSPYVKDRVNL